MPKYLNTPRTNLYDKSHALLGVGEQAAHLRSGATPVLVEPSATGFRYAS